MKLEQIIFVDFEVVPQENPYTAYAGEKEGLPVSFMRKFSKEVSEINEIEDLQEFYASKAPLMAEFGKIVCSSIGKWMNQTPNIPEGFYVKTIAGHNERDVLVKALTAINRFEDKTYICAHNGKEYDFPVFCRRAIINELPIPTVLNAIGVPPWQTRLLDTMEMWSMSQWKNRISLDLLCDALGVESPKNGGITGADICRLYYTDENGLDKIAAYCPGDVVAMAQCYCRINGMPVIKKDKIFFI